MRPCHPSWAQATFEPSDRHGIGYLEALRSALAKRGQYRYKGQSDAWKKLGGSTTGKYNQMLYCGKAK